MPNTAIDTLLSSITDALRCEGEFSELSNRSCSDQLDAISALIDQFKLKQGRTTPSQDVAWDPTQFVGFGEAELKLIRFGFMGALERVARLEKPAPVPIPDTRQLKLYFLLITEACDRGYVPYLVGDGRNSAPVLDADDASRQLFLGKYTTLTFRRLDGSSLFDFWVSFDVNGDGPFITGHTPSADATLIARVITAAEQEHEIAIA